MAFEVPIFGISQDTDFVGMQKLTYLLIDTNSLGHVIRPFPRHRSIMSRALLSITYRFPGLTLSFLQISCVLYPWCARFRALAYRVCVLISFLRHSWSLAINSGAVSTDAETDLSISSTATRLRLCVSFLWKRLPILFRRIPYVQASGFSGSAPARIFSKTVKQVS